MNPDSRANLFLAEHQRESILINHRVTWLLASQSFLFALMTFLIRDKQDLPEYGKSIINILPWLGLSITFFLLLSIIGAYRAMRNMEKLEYAAEISTITCKSKMPRIFGMIGSIGTSVSFLVVWIYILLLPF